MLFFVNEHLTNTVAKYLNIWSKLEFTWMTFSLVDTISEIGTLGCMHIDVKERQKKNERNHLYTFLWKSVNVTVIVQFKASPSIFHWNSRKYITCSMGYMMKVFISLNNGTRFIWSCTCYLLFILTCPLKQSSKIGADHWIVSFMRTHPNSQNSFFTEVTQLNFSLLTLQSKPTGD